MSHVVLVAFEVESDSPADAQDRLIKRLVPLLKSRDDSSPIECWWMAEDERRDGSDCDSAVFVKPGSQIAAVEVLRREGLAY